MDNGQVIGTYKDGEWVIDGKTYTYTFGGLSLQSLHFYDIYVNNKSLVLWGKKMKKLEEKGLKCTADLDQKIKSLEVTDEITVTSGKAVAKVRAINPYVLTAYTSVIGIGDIETLDAADIISIQETFATYENIERIHRAGKRVFVWTINEMETMEKLVNLNVDAILTNSPTLCKTVIDDYRSNVMNVVHRLQYAFTFL
jgi:hypothetical protein